MRPVANAVPVTRSTKPALTPERGLTRILIVDDHEMVRRGVRSVLSRENGMEVCAEAVDGRDAITKASEFRPDVVVTDISMPNLNGIDATREIRRILPDAYILILSQHDLPEMMRQALRAGANGYVLKSAVATDLVAALKKVRNGQPSFDPGVYGSKQANAIAEEISPPSKPEDTSHALDEKARLLDLSTDAIIVRDPADRITFWNHGATLTYGYGREEAVGRVTHELFRTNFPEPLQGIKETLQRDGRWAGELVHTRADGSQIAVISRWALERDPQGSIVSILETNRDISGQKLAEQAQFRLAAIVESSEDAIVSKDLNGIITSWNAAAQRIFGFTPKEAIGRPITIIIPPELWDEEKQILHRLRAGERVDHFETIRQTKKGARLHVSLTISPVRDARGRIIGASKIARDISEQKRMEQVLKEVELSGRFLQLQDEERRRVARELHDGVGQLLAALSMSTAMVTREKEKLSADAARCVEGSSSLIEQAISEIRTVSHLLHPPLLDEIGLESALTEYVHGFGERSNIRMTLDLPEKLGHLPRDYDMCVFRIVQECLTNIHRHSGSATAQVRLSRNQHELQLEVADQGRGIGPEIQEKFFAGKSTGVGLRGMRERVRQVGGSLKIESNGSGTSILVMLPIHAETSAAATG